MPGRPSARRPRLSRSVPLGFRRERAGDRAVQARPAGVLPGRRGHRAVATHAGPRGRLHRLADRRLPVRAAADGGTDGLRDEPDHGGGGGPARRAGRPRPRGGLDPVRGPRAAAGRDRRAGPCRSDRPDPEGLRRAHPARAGPRPARRGARGRGDRRRLAEPPADPGAVADGRLRRGGPVRHPGDDRVGRARVRPGRAAQPQALHLRAGRPGHRRAGRPRTPRRCT